MSSWSSYNRGNRGPESESRQRRMAVLIHLWVKSEFSKGQSWNCPRQGAHRNGLQCLLALRSPLGLGWFEGLGWSAGGSSRVSAGGLKPAAPSPAPHSTWALPLAADVSSPWVLEGPGSCMTQMHGQPVAMCLVQRTHWPRVVFPLKCPGWTRRILVGQGAWRNGWPRGLVLSLSCVRSTEILRQPQPCDSKQDTYPGSFSFPFRCSSSPVPRQPRDARGHRTQGARDRAQHRCAPRNRVAIFTAHNGTIP
jgi:hypothetical protein